MNKIIFVTGGIGTGKSTYIKTYLSDPSKFYVFDMALQSKKLFGHYDAIEDDDLIVDIYNSLTEEAMFAMLDNLDLVVEYCTDGYDDELFAIIKEARNSCIKTESVHLTTDAEEAKSRVRDAKLNSDYYPSLHFKEDAMKILSGVIETYEMNRGFELVCEVAAGEETIKLFRKGREENEQFFYMGNDSLPFEFEPQFDFEKSSDANYVKEFDTLEEALESLQDEFSIFALSPVEIDAKYKSQFKKAYHKLLDENGGNIPFEAWSHSMN